LGYGAVTIGGPAVSAGGENIYTVSGSTGIPITRNIWLAGFSNAGPSQMVPSEIIQVSFSSASGAVWYAQLTLLYKDGGNESFSYSVQYYYQ
jgi:hypothetical protein